MTLGKVLIHPSEMLAILRKIARLQLARVRVIEEQDITDLVGAQAELQLARVRVIEV